MKHTLPRRASTLFHDSRYTAYQIDVRESDKMVSITGIETRDVRFPVSSSMCAIALEYQDKHRMADRKTDRLLDFPRQDWLRCHERSGRSLFCVLYIAHGLRIQGPWDGELI